YLSCPRRRTLGGTPPSGGIHSDGSGGRMDRYSVGKLHPDGYGPGSDPPSIRLGISATRTLPSNHRKSGAPALPRQSLKAGPSAHPLPSFDSNSSAVQMKVSQASPLQRGFR